MADVMAAYLRGRQAAEAEREHEQAMATSKLQQMVLKHHLSGLKLEDALRANELKRQYADLAIGQDEEPPSAASGGAAMPSGATAAPPDVSAPAASAAPVGPLASGYQFPPTVTGPGPAAPASLTNMVQDLVGSRLGSPTSGP